MFGLMKKYIVLMMSLIATLLMSMNSMPVFAASQNNVVDNNIGTSLKKMGFSESQIALLPEEILTVLAAYGNFKTDMIEFRIDEKTGELEYFVLSTPKAEAVKLGDFSEQALLNIGYSEDEISLLPVGCRLEIASEKKGLHLDSFDCSTGELETDTLAKSDGINGARGEISDDQMNITTAVVDYGTTNNLNTKKIVATFTWLQDPYFRLTDKLGISYSHSWAIDSSRGELVYQCQGESTGNLYTFYYYNGQYSAGTGVAYESIDIKNVYYDEHTTNHCGWATLYIQHYVNQTNNYVRTNVLSKYFHKKLSLEGSLTLDPQPSISISNGSSYDWKQKMISFDWRE